MSQSQCLQEKLYLQKPWSRNRNCSVQFSRFITLRITLRITPMHLQVIKLSANELIKRPKIGTVSDNFGPTRRRGKHTNTTSSTRAMFSISQCSHFAHASTITTNRQIRPADRSLTHLPNTTKKKYLKHPQEVTDRTYKSWIFPIFNTNCHNRHNSTVKLELFACRVRN